MISTILLLPNADTRERLLAPGAPVWLAHPVATEQGWTVGTIGIDAFDEDGDPLCCWDGDEPGYARAAYVHLVLARDGAVVPEGVDRLCRVERSTPDCPFWDPFRLEGALTALLSGEHPPLAAARALFPLGTLLLLDSSGSEVSP